MFLSPKNRLLLMDGIFEEMRIRFCVTEEQICLLKQDVFSINIFGTFGNVYLIEQLLDFKLFKLFESHVDMFLIAIDGWYF